MVNTTDMYGRMKEPSTGGTGLAQRALTDHKGRRKEALGQIVARYWRPPYRFVRQRGYSNEDAKDLVQGFFAEKILADRDALQRFDRSKAPFRAFLLGVLKNYLLEQERFRRAQKRRPPGGLVSFEQLMDAGVAVPAAAASAEMVYEEEWAWSVFHWAADQTKEYYTERELPIYWEMFAERRIRPGLRRQSPPSLAQVAEKYGVPNTGQVTRAVSKVAEVFVRSLRDSVREFARSEEEISAEIAHLRKVISDSIREGRADDRDM